MAFYDAVIYCDHGKLIYLRLIFHRTQCASKRVVCSQAAGGIFLGTDLAAKANGIFFFLCSFFSTHLRTSGNIKAIPPILLLVFHSIFCLCGSYPRKILSFTTVHFLQKVMVTISIFEVKI